ncbi:unnamed protein product [Clonostachys solani]|uniref:NB-ARC domain-containing protein n=1 Tax=Clonostachys solani TaxID=160281 RepID=A0A9N9W6R3_9HYPO|nr:unnamed protein product [Clonostachys solani]
MNDKFFGRDNVLEDISKRFWGSSENGDAMTETTQTSDKAFQWIVLYGLKGIGKTRIVHEYVSRWRDRYDDIFYIPASDPTVFAGRIDQIHACGSIGVFSQWLKSQTMRRRWLLVVDDVVEDTVEQALSLPSPRLRTGELGTGHVLFTTYSDKLAKLSLNRGNVIEVHYLEEEDSKRLFLSVSRSQHDEWGDDILSMLPKYPISINLIATAVLNDNLNKTELRAVLRDSREQAEYMKNDRKLGVVFRMMQRKFEEDGQKSLFLAVLSHLHTTSLDLRLLLGCLVDRPFQSEQPRKRSKFLKLFKPSQPLVDHRPGASTVERNRVQLREISPPLTTAGLGSMGSLASQYASLSLIRRHEWSIHIPDVFRDHIRTLASKSDKELSHKHFTLSLVLAIEITLVRESLFSDDQKLAESFASLVNSLTRHARNHDLQTWEHFYLAELNFQVAAYLCSRSWSSIGVQTYKQGVKHWEMSHTKDNAHFFGHIENYGLALVDERKYDDAETYLRAAYDGLRKVERKNSPAVIRARHNVVNIKQEKGLLAEAAEGFKKMLTDYKGKIELEDWMGLRLSYAMAVKDQGRYSDAWKELESALGDLSRPSKANSGNEAAISETTARIFVYDVALILMNLSRHNEADNLFRCVISSTDNMLQRAVTANDTISKLISTVLASGTDDSNSQCGDEQLIFDAEFCLGLSLIEQEQYEAAASHFSRVKKDMDRLTSLGESALLLNCTNRTLFQEGMALSAFFCGAYEEAEAGFLNICDELKELENKAWCPLRMVRVKEGLAMARGMQSKIGRGDLEAAMEFSKKHFGHQHPELYITFHRFAMVMEKQGDIGTAAQWYSEAYHGRLKILSEHHILTKQSELSWRTCLRSEK